MIRLRQSKGSDSGRELEFEQELIRIGRMPDSDVDFDPEVDLDASGRHAELRYERGRYLLVDTGSRNGTWLNGQRIKHAAVADGDEIEFGRGGPKIIIVSIRDIRDSREPTVRIRTSTRPTTPPSQAPAMPVTTTTHLDDLQATLGTQPEASTPRELPAVDASPESPGRARALAAVLVLAGLALCAWLIIR